jgi:hypothetical protein
MGIWKKLFGGADGCREAMAESYQKHVRLAQQGHGTDEPPHRCGLYGALGTRYMSGGDQKPEPLLWGELAPFLAMDPDTGLKALTEYVVYQEYSASETDLSWLSGQVNSALRVCNEEDVLGLACLGLDFAPWNGLLDEDVRRLLEQKMAELGG